MQDSHPQRNIESSTTNLTTMATTTETVTKTANDIATSHDLPSPFSSRYEIRRLTEKDVPVAAAIMLHTNIFSSTVWTHVYPEHSTRLNIIYDGIPAADYLVRHQVLSGHSFGVFDTEYKYRTSSAKAASGELQWDLTNRPNLTAEELDAQIDSPIMSIALSYDGFNPLDMSQLADLIGLLPLYGAIFHRFDTTDPRDPESYKPTAEKQILMRNSTSTRVPAQGLGIMSKMANWLMLYAQKQGFKHINIEAFSEVVGQVWRNPKGKGMSATEPTAFRVEDFKAVNEKGEIYRPFGEKCVQRVCRVFVNL
jgi:hypothetical protein